MALWSKLSTLDREICGSNLGGVSQKYLKNLFEKIMPRILSRPESVRDRKAEGISRKNGRAEGTSPVGGT